ncbi:MAG: hypothetical protein RIQ78_1329, partial [Bacteroidota bacterium]
MPKIFHFARAQSLLVLMILFHFATL